jgi:hypothetical protein
MISAPGSIPASAGYGLISTCAKPWIVVQTIWSSAFFARSRLARSSADTCPGNAISRSPETSPRRRVSTNRSMRIGSSLAANSVKVIAAYVLRVDPRGEQHGDATRNYRGLPGACSGLDQERAPGVGEGSETCIPIACRKLTCANEHSVCGVSSTSVLRVETSASGRVSRALERPPWLVGRFAPRWHASRGLLKS